MKTVIATATRFVIVLGLICLVMGSGVAILYAAFKDRIAQKSIDQFNLVLKQVLPGGQTRLLTGSPDDGTDVYAEIGPDGKPTGYAARGWAQGYSSQVKVLVGTEADAALTIRKVVVLDQQETPGLGANVSLTKSTYTFWQVIHVAPAKEPEKLYNGFLDQFNGRAVDQLNQVDAMTAATITSNATKKGVREAVQRIRDALAAAAPAPQGQQGQLGKEPAGGGA